MGIRLFVSSLKAAAVRAKLVSRAFRPAADGYERRVLAGVGSPSR